MHAWLNRNRFQFLAFFSLIPLNSIPTSFVAFCLVHRPCDFQFQLHTGSYNNNVSNTYHFLSNCEWLCDHTHVHTLHDLFTSSILIAFYRYWDWTYKISFRFNDFVYIYNFWLYARYFGALMHSIHLDLDINIWDD